MRDEFRIPRADGSANGLPLRPFAGLQPKPSRSASSRRSWTDWAQRASKATSTAARPWLSYHERFAPALARLVGAQPLEVVAMNTLTVNLHLMLATFYRPTRERPKILIEQQAFSVGPLRRRIAGALARLRSAQRCSKSAARRRGSLRTEDVLSCDRARRARRSRP